MRTLWETAAATCRMPTQTTLYTHHRLPEGERNEEGRRGWHEQ